MSAPQIDIGDKRQLFSRFTAVISVCAAMFGIHLVTGFATLYVLAHKRHRPHSKKHLTYVFILLVLGFINFVFFVVTMRDGMTLISTNLETAYGNPDDIPTFALTHGVTAVLITVLTELYLVYRCFLIWERCYTVIFIPVLMFLATIALGILNLIDPPNTFANKQPLWDPTRTSAIFDVVPLSPFTFPIPVIYWALCLALNIGLTVLIVAKLLSRRSIVRRCFGAEHGSTYTGLAAMMVESSLLYSVVAGVGYPLLPQNLMGNNNMFSPLLAQSECIASELIILRFAMGRAWTEETASSLMQPPSPVEVKSDEKYADQNVALSISGDLNRSDSSVA